MHDEPGIVQSPVDRRNEPVDCVGRESEEVEVARLAVNVAAEDQRPTAREYEALRFLEAGDDRGHLLLQRAEYLLGAAAAL